MRLQSQDLAADCNVLVLQSVVLTDCKRKHLQSQ